MPEGAIDEQGNAMFPQNKIGSASQIPCLSIGDQTGSGEQLGHDPFRAGIASADAGHDTRPGSCVHNIPTMGALAMHTNLNL
jgi:hypothetical protein